MIIGTSKKEKLGFLKHDKVDIISWLFLLE
jgi:hypothetical protein